MPAPTHTARPLIEWLMELPEGYREMALANHTAARWDTSAQFTCMDRAISYSFSFDETPEGYEFWQGVCRYFTSLQSSSAATRHAAKLPSLNPEPLTTKHDATTPNIDNPYDIRSWVSDRGNTFRRALLQGNDAYWTTAGTHTRPLTEAEHDSRYGVPGSIHDQWVVRNETPSVVNVPTYEDIPHPGDVDTIFSARDAVIRHRPVAAPLPRVFEPYPF